MVARCECQGEACKNLIHWMIGTRDVHHAHEVWAVKNCSSQLLIATLAMSMWNQLFVRLGQAGITAGEWIRMTDQDKTVSLLAVKIGLGPAMNLAENRGMEADETFCILLRDWSINALVEWSKDIDTAAYFPKPEPRPRRY